MVYFMPDKSGFTDTEDCVAYFIYETNAINNTVLIVIFISTALMALDNYNFWKDKQMTEKAKKLLKDAKDKKSSL